MESAEQRERRLQRKRDRLANESAEHRKERLEKQRVRDALRRQRKIRAREEEQRRLAKKTENSEDIQKGRTKAEAKSHSKTSPKAQADPTEGKQYKVSHPVPDAGPHPMRLRTRAAVTYNQSSD